MRQPKCTSRLLRAACCPNAERCSWNKRELRKRSQNEFPVLFPWNQRCEAAASNAKWPCWNAPLNLIRVLGEKRAARSAVRFSDMKRIRHSPEQIVKKLHQAATELACGKNVEEVCKSLAISRATYHRWWLKRQAIGPLYIAPGSPWENAYVESFNSRVRDEHLNREEFASLLEAQVLSAGWRRDYNDARPHSALGYLAPAVFAARYCLGVGTDERHIARGRAWRRRPFRN